MLESIIYASSLESIDMDAVYPDQVSAPSAVFQDLSNTDSITHTSNILNQTIFTQLPSGAEALDWMERTNYEGGS